MANPQESSTRTVLILFFCLVGLIGLLIFLYRKLNKEANGKYTIRRMVYREGGIRDRVRGAALSLETCLGVQLWPHSNSDQDGEEMQEVQDEEGQVEDGDSEGSDSEEDDQEEEDSAELCGKAKEEGSDISGDESSVEGAEAGEQSRQADEQEAKGETGEKKVGDGKGEASGGTGLLIDLKQFSGSAIWSEEGGSEGKGNDVTAL